jgi:hypothetical protein
MRWTRTSRLSKTILSLGLHECDEEVVEDEVEHLVYDSGVGGERLGV